MNTEIFHKYADIKTQIKELTAQAKEIEQTVASEFEKLGMDKIESSAGSFYFTTRKKWSYSDTVAEKEAEVKSLKKQEEESGVATAEETKSITFRSANKK